MAITAVLADDHAVVRDGLRYVLESQGDIQVIGEATNGREAVHQAQLLHPDVVVIDISMPELNGIDATEQIRQVSPSTEVVVLSMHSSGEHVLRALQAGARGFVLKESAGKEVADAVRTVHAGHRYLSPKVADLVIGSALHPEQARNPLSVLSAREREVLQLTVEGKSAADIAAILSLSPKTVETYRSRLMQKLGIKDLPALVKFAIQHGLTPLE